MVFSLVQIRGVTTICAILLLLSVAGAVHAERHPLDKEPPLSELTEPPVTTLEELVTKSSPRKPREGFASYYASRFIGKRTTSGHRYHPEKLTAAHHTLPMGTVVRVVNPATSQEVSVTINDRCSSRPFPFIDLSRAAAKKIGLLGKGRIKVVIIPLLEDSVQDPA